MCGRFTREFTWRQVHDFLSLPLEWLERAPQGFGASWNVAPAQGTLAARAGAADGAGGGAGREAVMMQWGLRPAWMEGGVAPINARCETVATSPMFKRAFRQRRCIVPASGFYEWKRTGERKQPWYIRLRGAPIMGLAGVWEVRKPDGDAGEGWLMTFAILTTRANEFMGAIHDRMPVILAPDRFEQWLGTGEVDARTLGPIESDRMEGWPVSARVNTPRNDDRRLVEPVEETEPEPGLFE